MDGFVAPLWQLINQCRQECDTKEWCHSFAFHINDKTCKLSSGYPKIVPVDEGGDTDLVVFVQNANYNRSDYVLEN